MTNNFISVVVSAFAQSKVIAAFDKRPFVFFKSSKTVAEFK